MKKFFFFLNLLIIFILLVGCGDKEEAKKGEFLLGDFGAEFKDDTYYLVVPIEWTGDTPVTIKSIELIKRDEKPVTYGEDGIKYEVYGADPLKSQGIYIEGNIGMVKDLNNFEIEDEGKIVLLLSLLNVEKDSERKLKIRFIQDGVENEENVVWNTLEQLTTK